VADWGTGALDATSSYGISDNSNCIEEKRETNRRVTLFTKGRNPIMTLLPIVDEIFNEVETELKKLRDLYSGIAARSVSIAVNVITRWHSFLIIL
jgi:hypothetical protein